MLFSLRELVQWLGFAPLELLLQGLALLGSSVLLVLKVDAEAGGEAGSGGVSASGPGPGPGLSWWGVLGPLFAADGLSTYFTAIVSVRLFQDGEKRLAVLRLFWVLTLLSLKFVFEMLLCQKLSGRRRQHQQEHQQEQKGHELWFGLILSPLFILLQLLMIRACRVN